MYQFLKQNLLNYYFCIVFQVRATEMGTASPRNGATNVIVIVRDLNDNPPVFTSTSYAVSTAEKNYSTSPQLLVTVCIYKQNYINFVLRPHQWCNG